MRVYKVSDNDWWMAETAEQARESAIQAYDGDDDELVWPIEDIKEVSESNMERLKVDDEDDGTVLTFKELLAKRLKAGETKPDCFATSEY